MDSEPPPRDIKQSDSKKIDEKMYTRRKLLKLFGAVAGAVALADYQAAHASTTPTIRSGEPINNPVNEQQPSLPVGIERLKQEGLEEYIDTYKSMRKLSDTFLVNTVYDGLFFDLFMVANGSQEYLPSGKIEEYKKEWGTDRSTAIKDASDKARRLKISQVPEGQTPEQERQVLLALAKVAPPYVLCMQEDAPITFLEGGGEGFLHEPKFTSIKNKKYAGVTALHEGEHMFSVGWSTVTQYLDKQKFLKYVQAYADTVYIALEKVVNEPATNIYTAKDGKPLLMLYLPEDENEKRKKMEEIKKWEEMFVSPSNQTFPAGVRFQDEAQEAEFRYNRVAYHICKKLYEIQKKVEKGIALTDEEKNLSKSPPMSVPFEIAKSVLEEVTHFMVGPIQKVDEGLPLDNDTIPPGFYFTMDKNLQTQRMAAVSTSYTPPSLTEIAKTFDFS